MSRRIPPDRTDSIGSPNTPFVAIVVLVAMLLPLGCAGVTGLPRTRSAVSTAPPPPLLEPVPTWALASTQRRYDGKLVGIGSGRSLDQATRYALSDVASRLSVSVESRLRDVYREIDGTSTASLEHVIETRVLGTRFSAWERTRSVRIEDVFWVEVQIERSRLVRESRLALAEAASNVDRIMDGAQPSALARLIAPGATAADRDRVSSLVALIDTLDPTFDREDWDRRRAGWRAIDESARRSLIFEVRADPASREIAHWLESQLASERLATRPGGCLAGNTICIDIRSEIVETDIASRHVARIRSYFSILEPGGSVVREVDFSGRGNSTVDSERAKRMALDDLRKNFEAASILGSLIEP